MEKFASAHLSDVCLAKVSLLSQARFAAVNNLLLQTGQSVGIMHEALVINNDGLCARQGVDELHPPLYT